jgi:hypothetical protein
VVAGDFNEFGAGGRTCAMMAWSSWRRCAIPPFPRACRWCSSTTSTRAASRRCAPRCRGAGLGAHVRPPAADRRIPARLTCGPTG